MYALTSPAHLSLPHPSPGLQLPQAGMPCQQQEEEDVKGSGGASGIGDSGRVQGGQKGKGFGGR